MGKQYASKSTLFLMELVVAIFFFAICAAICVSVFAFGQRTARDSDNLGNAVLATRSAASCYKAAEGNLQDTAALLEGAWEDGQVKCYYDENWQPLSSEQQADFVLQISQPRRIGEVVIVVQSQKNDQELFRLAVKAAGGEPHEE
jgi:hypothetical protein